MANFTGTRQEFKRYIGPRLRNFVQVVTRKHRRAVGACEYCGDGTELQSAHVRGRDRSQIIDLLLSAISEEHLVSVDLEQFERSFRSEHYPVEKAILILCRKCHIKYDSVDTSNSPPTQDTAKVAKHFGDTTTIDFQEGILPITLEPSQLVEFKRELLTCRRAGISVFYSDGRVEHRIWDASKFSESSNVMQNLRSRPELRQGVWRKSGIVKVHVRIA